MRVNGDKYYGAAAENYDFEREHSVRWEKENAAVAAFVDEGPVLDVPLGTGRYVPIYRRKGLDFLGADISRDMLAVAKRRHGYLGYKASILALPYLDRSFATAVCTRMLDWLPPAEMERAVAELRRVAETLIVTLRHGTEGISINYTHSLERFYRAIDGLFIEARRTTEITRHGHEEIFKLRPPVWQDVEAQFRWHEGPTEAAIHRITGVGVDRTRLSLAAEYWTSDQAGAALDAAGGLSSEYSDCPEPRFEGDAAVVLETGGRQLIVDGQRRFNMWRATPGRYPVLVIRQ
jgi:hypothetical protein